MEEASKQTLVRKRTSLKTALTAQENFFINFNIESLKDYKQISSRLEQIKTIYPKFNEIQFELESIDPESDPTEREHFERHYFELIAHCETLLHDSQFNPDNSSSQTTDGFRGFPSPEQ